jgi:hypothetical protein
MPGYQLSPLPCSAFNWGADFVGPIVIVDVGVVRTAADNGQNSGHAIRLTAALGINFVHMQCHAHTTGPCTVLHLVTD